MPRSLSYGPTCGDHCEREVAAAQADGVQPCPRCAARQPRRVERERVGQMRPVRADH